MGSEVISLVHHAVYIHIEYYQQHTNVSQNSVYEYNTDVYCKVFTWSTSLRRDIQWRIQGGCSGCSSTPLRLRNAINLITAIMPKPVSLAILGYKCYTKLSHRLIKSTYQHI